MNKCKKILLALLLVGVMVGGTGCGCTMQDGDAGQDSTMESTDLNDTTTVETTRERDTTGDYRETTMDRETNEHVTDGVLEEIGSEIGNDLGINGTDNTDYTTETTR